MKVINLLLIVSIFALLVLAGCSSSAEKSYAPSGQQYVGGGCGVGAPAEDTGNAVGKLATAIDTAASA